jgi:hypothetical protein
LLKDGNWQHEDASEMMFDDMIQQYNMDLPRQDVEFIKALIAGDQARCRSELYPCAPSIVISDYF